MAGDVASMISPTVDPSTLNGTSIEPREHARVGHEGQDHGALRGHEANLGPRADADTLEIQRVDVGSRRRGERGQAR